MSEGEFKKRISAKAHTNTGRISWEELPSAINLNDLKEILNKAHKDIFSVFPKKTIIGTRVGGDGDEYNEEGYSEEDIEKLRVVLLKWFGKNGKTILVYGDEKHDV